MSLKPLDPGLLSDLLADNGAMLPLAAERKILAASNRSIVIPCRHLDLKQFSRLGCCEMRPEPVPRPGLYRYWGGEDNDRLYSSYQQCVWEVQWNGQSLRVIHLEWENECGGDSRDWVIAETTEIAESFILDVERKTHSPGNAILVFSGGCWTRSHALYDATQTASFDDLVLADGLRETIRSEFGRFLASEDQYERLGIAWRRGALLIGPPGNGKTHCVRALVKELGVASLYVQSLSHEYYTAEQLWQQVFDRARGLHPCVLVLEDLDSLVTDDNRSFFLNQLDGFERNHGLMVLATTNHPERIDSAIIDRPSRFDRKYHFHLPSNHERRRYLADWQQRLQIQTGWQLDETEAIADFTQSFSFAYLKELVISAVMQWMHDSDRNFAEVMIDQADVLKSQMKTESTASAVQDRWDSELADL